MSFRATGEGHLSSIEFRSGIVDENDDMYLDPVSHYVATPELHTDPVYERRHFQRKLQEMGVRDRDHEPAVKRSARGFYSRRAGTTDNPLSDQPNFDWRINTTRLIRPCGWRDQTTKWFFVPDHPISERVIFPVSENESSGIEDARFVRFVDDDGSVTFYATYTAYNGREILPQLLDTDDFLTFKMHTLSGNAAQNKGMALFPRKINGQYVMLSRQDGVNNYIMFSDSLRYWNDATPSAEALSPA